MSQVYETLRERIEQLPEAERDQWCQWLLEDLEDELRWQELFEHSQDMLSQLADEALQAHRSGKTTPLWDQ
ncbi:MAG: hypothetical protein KIT45_14740 [Fimbriimonadia bacterium]|nr:hypothetical protein [Fimbriimonadia bacterium]